MSMRTRYIIVTFLTMLVIARYGKFLAEVRLAAELSTPPVDADKFNTKLAAVRGMRGELATCRPVSSRCSRGAICCWRSSTIGRSESTYNHRLAPTADPRRTTLGSLSPAVQGPSLWRDFEQLAVQLTVHGEHAIDLGTAEGYAFRRHERIGSF
jgi:hypothetical protein